jgi:hypothetical protein
VTHEVEDAVVEVKEDRIADELAGGVHRHELLGLVDSEVGEGVDTEVAQQAQGIRPADEDVGHVVRLVEQRARRRPGSLLGAPVGELGSDREGVGSGRGVAEQLHRAPGPLDGLREALDDHGSSSLRVRQRMPATLRTRGHRGPRRMTRLAPRQMT